MMETYLDDIIDYHLDLLKENKYHLRQFKVELILSIESAYGIEETLADIRSIPGVTIVTALESVYNEFQKKYVSRIKQLEDENKVLMTRLAAQQRMINAQGKWTAGIIDELVPMIHRLAVYQLLGFAKL